MTDSGVNIDEISTSAMDYLKSNGAFEGRGGDDSPGFLKVTTDMINHVLGQGRDAVKRDCPHGGGKMCGGCVIL